ncbi:MAG: DUF3786 domain-containing protein [Desulfosudaceae bacterium]
MDKTATVFEENYNRYREQIRQLDLAAVAGILGLETETGAVSVPWLGKILRVSGEGVVDAAGNRPDYGTFVVVSNYLLRCPAAVVPPAGWAHYRDFPTSGPLTVYFARDVEQALADNFNGRTEALRRAGRLLGGYVPEIKVRCDLSLCFYALPRVPVLLLFNDADEEFGADCSLLFDNVADQYLDAESLAILGRCLVEALVQAAGQ